MQTETSENETETKTNLRCRLLALSEPVDVTIEQNGELVSFDKYGRLTNPVKEGMVVLTVAMPPEYPVWGFHIEETHKTLSILKNEAGEGQGSVFRQRIPIHRTVGGKTLYPDLRQANIRWIEISHRHVAETEIGVIAKMFVATMVSQNGIMFLAYQEMCSEEAFLIEGRVKIPGLRRSKAWIDLGKYLEVELQNFEGLQFRSRKLGEIEIPKRKSCDEILAENLPEDEGVVQWYSLRMQSGCVVTKEGPARIHWSQIRTERPDGLKYVLEGEWVSFTNLVNPRKPQETVKNLADVKRPGRKTEFDLEVKEVEVL